MGQFYNVGVRVPMMCSRVCIPNKCAMKTKTKSYVVVVAATAQRTKEWPWIHARRAARLPATTSLRSRDRVGARSILSARSIGAAARGEAARRTVHFRGGRWTKLARSISFNPARIEEIRILSSDTGTHPVTVIKEGTNTSASVTIPEINVMKRERLSS